jgi:type VI secretion system secreted protein VgrG
LNADKIQFEAKSEVSIKTGSAEIVMKKNGDISIKGNKLTINGSGDVVIKGSTIKQN